MALSGEPVFCHGIRQILDEMIYNITENAIKYNRDGGSVSVWVGNTLDGPKISVSDTGIGIPEEHQERIFERFYRVDKSHSKERGGTGLGLSIVKHGAILHGAKVTVNSEPGKGTKIEIRVSPKEEKKCKKGRSSLNCFPSSRHLKKRKLFLPPDAKSWWQFYAANIYCSCFSNGVNTPRFLCNRFVL